ncbi:hypothetical protein JYQ62_02100 [Nostoc sp. UHCC 0702]|nr:hypothetical protein JYQ62_02100 [Nostoc sp. UHCC 0702]
MREGNICPKVGTVGEVPPDVPDDGVDVVTVTLFAVTIPKTDFLIVHCLGSPKVVFEHKTKPTLPFLINPDLTIPLLCLLAENVAI